MSAVSQDIRGAATRNSASGNLSGHNMARGVVAGLFLLD
jgi:hypothetical protein